MNTPSRITVTTIGTLMFLLAFVVPIAAEFKQAAEHHYFPDTVRMLSSMLEGTAAGLTTLLAFLNTSFARFQDNKKPEVKE